jgi:hypothetical protein
MPKTRAKPLKMCCGEAHPTNYGGCIVAKEQQKIRNNAIRGKTENMLCENAKRQAQYALIQAGRSYAQKVRSNNEQAQDILQEDTIS